MTVRDTSLIAYEKLKETLGPDEQAVFEILLETGPAHDRRILEALNQKEQAALKPAKLKRKWDINSVTGRRNGLVGKGAVIDLGTHAGTWCGKVKTYHLWRAIGDDRLPVGWVMVTKGLPKPKRPWPERKANAERIRAAGEDSVVQKMAASEAGRVLVAQRYRKRRQPQRQELLFG